MGVITAGAGRGGRRPRGASNALQDLDYPGYPSVSPKVPPETSIDDLVPLAAATECIQSQLWTKTAGFWVSYPRTVLLTSLAGNHQTADPQSARESVVR